jgi:hypothetical protein
MPPPHGAAMTKNATHEPLAMALACGQVIDNYLSVSFCQRLLLRTGSQ